MRKMVNNLTVSTYEGSLYIAQTNFCGTFESIVLTRYQIAILIEWLREAEAELLLDAIKSGE